MMRTPALTNSLLLSSARLMAAPTTSASAIRLTSGKFVLLCAAALSGSSSHAFVPHRAASSRTTSISSTRNAFGAAAVVSSPPPLHTDHRIVRLYSSRRDDEEPNMLENIVGKAKQAAKSILPKKWFKDDKALQASIERKRVKNEVTGGLKEILKDAPLPVRMMGSLVAPLMSNLASTISESMQEQRREMEDLLNDARTCIVRDEILVRQLGGDPITVMAPFSQSSSSMNINGKVSSKVQAQFEVVGSTGRGVASMVATENGIDSLNVNVDGRSYNVDVGKISGTVGTGTKTLGRNRINEDDVIDAEFVEKKYK